MPDLDHHNYDLMTRRPTILRGLPRHTSMGIWADNPDAMARFARYAVGQRLSAEDLIRFADSPVRHNGCHEEGDKRNRYIDQKNRRFVRNVVGAHFVPSEDATS